MAERDARRRIRPQTATVGAPVAETFGHACGQGLEGIRAGALPTVEYAN